MDPMRDAPRQLEFTQDNITVVMNKTGEHQFFYLSLPEYSIPEKYTCAFTNYEAAKQAVDHLFEDHKKNPLLKTKKSK